MDPFNIKLSIMFNWWEYIRSIALTRMISYWTMRFWVLGEITTKGYQCSFGLYISDIHIHFKIWLSKSDSSEETGRLGIHVASRVTGGPLITGCEALSLIPRNTQRQRQRQRRQQAYSGEQFLMFLLNNLVIVYPHFSHKCALSSKYTLDFEY